MVEFDYRTELQNYATYSKLAVCSCRSAIEVQPLWDVSYSFGLLPGSERYGTREYWLVGSHE
jgi:hypothetical protein